MSFLRLVLITHCINSSKIFSNNKNYYYYYYSNKMTKKATNDEKANTHVK